MAENLILAENTLTTQFLDVYDVYGFTIPFGGDFSEFPLTLGDECVVVWDGAEHKVTVGDSSATIADTMFVGNGSAFGLPGNNEPFVIAWDGTGATFIALTDTSETSHTVEIYQVVSNDIILKDRHGNDLEGIAGAVEMRVPTTDGGFRSFTVGERVKTTINPNFSNGDMVVTPNNGEVFSEVTIKKPDGLVPESIPRGITIAGVDGELEIGGDVKGLIDRTLTSIVIPDGVASIGNYAFAHCKALTSITIPNSVTSIGNSAFNSCKALTSITIPNSVTSIGNSAFNSCANLASVVIPNSVTSIGNSMFYMCAGLTSVVLSDGMTSIPGGAFQGCTGLTSIEIPDSVTSIGNGAFMGCAALNPVVIGAGVKTIMPNAFQNCYDLSSVTFKDPSGWKVSTSSSGTSGTSVSVTNASTAATMLTSTYLSYYWFKT